MQIHQFKEITPLELSMYKSLIRATLSTETAEHLKRIAGIIQRTNKFLIVSHASPDGDAIASSLAMAFILEHLEKEYILYNETSPLPEFLNFLPKPQPFYHDLDNLPFKPEIIIVLDCGDRNRIGMHKDKLLKLAPSINIDHHLDNPNFASLENLVDTSMAATANIVACLAIELNTPLDIEICTCLYTGMVTDTGSFSYSNANTRAYLTSALLVACGVQPNLISTNLDSSWSERKNRLWAYLMSNYTFVEELETAYMLVTQAILEELEADKDDLEGFVEHLRKLHNVRIAFVLREKNASECKGSFRSSGKDDVQKLAKFFDGGGHKNAAGATFKTNMVEASEKILDTIRNNKNDFLPLY